VIRHLALAPGTVVVSDERPRRAGDLPPLVLLHGFTGSHASWESIRSGFGATRRVIAVDLPGHGATVMRGRGFDWSLAATADLVVAALDVMRVPRVVLVGYSMGGRIALQLALAHGARVERLVLESASAGLATAAARRRRRAGDEALARRIERDGVPAFVRRWEALPLFRSLATAPPEARATLRRRRLACTADGLAHSLRGCGLGAQPWLGDWLGALAMPVLLVTGAADRKFTRIAATLLPRFARASHEVVAGAGHMPHLEQPTRFRSALEWFLTGAADGRAVIHRGG
jgi:2-succinyl-6-hydroxy-2,4-cyclohexadiene-1-carboxylate synthase